MTTIIYLFTLADSIRWIELPLSRQLNTETIVKKNKTTKKTLEYMNT